MDQDLEQEQEPACFTGVFDHTLDEKGRVSLPAKIRKSLPKTLKTVLSLDKESVYVFSPKAYRAWVDKFFPNGMDPLSRKDVALKRRLTAFAPETDIDSAGRISIDARLREICGLEKDVTIIGCGEYLEIVDREKYRAQEEDNLDMDFMTD